MKNILKMKSISINIHWHKAQLDKQLPPFNTEDVLHVVYKAKMLDDVKRYHLFTQGSAVHQVLFAI